MQTICHYSLVSKGNRLNMNQFSRLVHSTGTSFCTYNRNIVPSLFCPYDSVQLKHLLCLQGVFVIAKTILFVRKLQALYAGFIFRRSEILSSCFRNIFDEFQVSSPLRGQPPRFITKRNHRHPHHVHLQTIIAYCT
mmetsp:Transcript_13863/g.17193  ORF Transcript_13863/g.17193 Transcript_13863/m.17193 type:complete len:136 (-) Transcript_13863:1407-1814(-)